MKTLNIKLNDTDIADSSKEEVNFTIIDPKTEDTDNVQNSEASVEEISSKKIENTTEDKKNSKIDKGLKNSKNLEKKQKTEKPFIYKNYVKKLENASDIIENYFESITKLLLPILFISIFAFPPLAILMSSLFIIDYIAYWFISEELKDIFKNKSKDIIPKKAEAEAKLSEIREKNDAAVKAEKKMGEQKKEETLNNLKNKKELLEKNNEKLSETSLTLIQTLATLSNLINPLYKGRESEVVSSELNFAP